jgi:hypothetical protein
MFLGVGFVALSESNDIWDKCVFTLTLGVLLVSILLAVHRTDSMRMFWIGFAVFGWTYLGLTLVPSIENRLPTTKTLPYLEYVVPARSLGIFTMWSDDGEDSEAISIEVLNDVFNSGDNQPVTSIQRPERHWYNPLYTPMCLISTSESFVRIGHSLVALIVAFFGGQLSRNLYARNRLSTPAVVSPDSHNLE